jgi:ElaA protein
MKIEVKTYQELTKEELYQILRLRTEVFVVEQDCVYQDIDNKDQKALHIIGTKENKIIAYTRVFKSGDYFENPSIGRVVVNKSNRKYGYGKDIMLASILAIENLFGKKEIELSAQVYLKNFYKDLNFKEKGEGYLEDGIPHIRMIRKKSDG